MKRFVFSLACLCAVSVFGDGVSFANPSDWTVANNYRGLLDIRLGCAVDGVSSLCVSGSAVTCDTAWSVLSRRFPLTKGAKGFRLDFEGRLDRNMPDTRPGHGNRNSMFWYDAAGKEIGSGALPFTIAGGERRSVFATGPVPEGAVFAAIQIGFDSPNIGPGERAVFRNLVFETFDWALAPSGSRLAGGDVRAPRVFVASESPTTNASTVLTLGVEDESDIDWKTLSLAVDGRDRTAEFARDGRTLRLAAQSGPWSAGLHKVRAALGDVKGNVETNTIAFFIGEAPKTPKASLRADGTVFVDGKPFFPIGIFAVCRREFNGMDFDKAFRDLKKAGFNIAHTYGNSYDPEFLAAAQKHDMKLWVASRFPSKDFVEVGRHHPSILAWYLGDDTSMHETPAELRSYRDAVTAVDPTRLTCQADVVGPAGSFHAPYEDYVDGTDVVMPEIYPVSGLAGAASDRECVARTISNMQSFNRAMARSKDGPKSCWPILQYFKGWSSWLHFPTREQLFATSFAAIVHGAHGITWYTYGGFYNKRRDYYDEGITSRPERFQDMADLCTWIQELSPALVAPRCEQGRVNWVSGAQMDPYGHPAVSARWARSGEESVLIAVNSAPEATRVRVVSPTAAASAEVMRENRRVTFAEGAFVDDFAPFAVHVYRWK